MNWIRIQTDSEKTEGYAINLDTVDSIEQGSKSISFYKSIYNSKEGIFEDVLLYSWGFTSNQNSQVAFKNLCNNICVNKKEVKPPSLSDVKRPVWFE
jgi:hypothetical protein